MRISAVDIEECRDANISETSAAILIKDLKGIIDAFQLFV